MAGAFELFTDDAVEWLTGFAAGSVPLLVLDPGVPGRAPRRARRADPVIPAFAEQRLPALLYEVHRVLARDRICWWVTETAHAFKAAHLAGRLGFVSGAPLVWDRGDGPGARLAFVLPLTHGRPRSPGAELVVAHRSEDAPTRLPAALCAALIEASSEPGELVVDPFMGSGALGLAALTLGRSYMGNDVADLIEAVSPRLAPLGVASEAAAALRVQPARTRTGDGDVTGDLAAMRRALGIGDPGQITLFGDGAELR